MSKKPGYKCCIVPECKNTSIRTPNKIFFNIPLGEQRRREWCRAMGRIEPKHQPLHANSTRFCCEDHFDLENDMANYLKWKLVGTSRLSLKKGVLPHKFHCQNRISSETRSSIEINPVNIKEELPDCDRNTVWINDVTSRESQDTDTSEVKTEDESVDYTPCKPYIVSIICVKMKKKRV